MKKKDIAALIACGIGLIAGIGTYFALDGAHWSVPVIVGLVVTACASMADLTHLSLTRTSQSDDPAKK